MSSGIQYRFSCHCQANIYTLTVPSTPSGATDPSSALSDAPDAQHEGGEVGQGIEEITVCDCSFCTKRLIVWARQPSSRVEFNKGCLEGKEGEGDGEGEGGRGTVGVYRFGQESLANHWCTKCGTYLYGTKSSEPGYLYLNLRVLREPFFSIYDLPSSRINQMQYADMGPVYTSPTLPAEVMDLIKQKQDELERAPASGDGESANEKGSKRAGTVVHVGSCHCQEVVFGYIGKRWEEELGGACLCSICYGNGNIWTGDPDDHIFFSPSHASNPHRPPSSTVTRYIFNPTAPSPNQHVFCNTCGCQVIEIKEDNVTQRRTLGVNVACFEGAGRYLGDGGRGQGWEALGKEQGAGGGEGGEEKRQGAKTKKAKCGVRVNAGPRSWDPQYRVKL